MEISRLGESGLIIRADQSPSILDTLLSWKNTLAKREINGVREMVPAYETLTVLYNPLEISYEELSHKLKAELSDSPINTDLCMGDSHEIPVCYEGELSPDLPRVSEHCKMSAEEIISLHTSTEFLVAGVGFSPGFGFLSGLPESLHCPRLSSPREKVPAGAVGIAARQTGVYPNETSGGWNLIGRSPAQFVDFNKSTPSLLKVGDRVKFTPICMEEFYEIGR